MTQANEKYIGVYIFNKLVSKDVDGKRNGNAYKDVEEIIRLEGAVPAIISREEFELAQRKIEARKQVRAANNAKEVYLLSGKIFCGECGGAFVGNRKYAGRNKTLQVTYRCSARKNKHTCMNKDIRKDYIEGFVLEKLAGYIFDESLIPRLVSEYKRYQMERDSEVVKKQESLKKRLADITKEISNLLILASKVASELLAQKLADLETEKNQVQEQYNLICDENNTGTATAEKIIESFMQAKEMLADGTLSLAKKFVELFIDRVAIYESHVSVTFKSHPDLKLPILFNFN